MTTKGTPADLQDLLDLQRELTQLCGEATLAVAKGRITAEGAKRPVEPNYLENPLSLDSDEARTWNDEVRKGEGAHYILLLRQCDPVLVVVDLDNMDIQDAKDILETCQYAPVRIAPSLGKGYHIPAVYDAGVRKLVPGDKAAFPLKTAKTKVKYGEVLTLQATAYKPSLPVSPIRRFSEIADGNLFTLMTGQEKSPDARLDDKLARLTDEMRAWPEGSRNEMMFQTCRTLAQALRDIDVYDEREKVFEHLSAEYTKVNKSDPWSVARIRECVERYDDGPSHALAGAGDRDLVERSAVHRVFATFDNNIVRVGSGKEATAVCWDPIRQTWVSYGYDSLDDSRGDTEMLPPFSGIIGRAVDEAHLDIKGKLCDLSAKGRSVGAVWDEIQRRCPGQRIFRAFDNAKEGDDERYHNVGGGQVIVTRAGREHLERGTACEIVPNRPEYRALRKTAPIADKPSQYFLDRAQEILPEEGVVDYMRLFWASMLLPPRLRPTTFHVCYGNGSSAKNSLNDAVARALGDFSVSTEISTFQEQKGGTDIRVLGERQAMVGADMVLVAESGDGRLDEQAIKTMATREEILVGGHYQKSTPARVTGSIVLLTNEFLKLKSVRRDIARRLRQVPFTQFFEANAKGEEIKERMKKEAPGILRMMYEDVTRLLEVLYSEHEIPVPKAIQEQTQEQLQEAAPVVNSLREFFSATDDHSLPLVQLGRESDEGVAGHVGISSVASLLIKEHGTGERYPVRKAKEFLRVLQVARTEPNRATFRLTPTDAFLSWVGSQTDLSVVRRRDLFYRCFARPAKAQEKYGQRLEKAIADGDAEQSYSNTGATQGELAQF